MKENGKHIKRRRRPPMWGVWICAVLAVAASLGVLISAKYVSSRKNDTMAAALPFYFESDYLAEEWVSYTLQEGVNTIAFDLYNYADELRFSEVDIVSTVTLKSGTEIIDTREINLTAGKKDAETIRFENLNPGNYTVSAVSSPYYKMLQASFSVRGADDGINYSVSDNAGSPFLKVEVTSAHYAGPVTITWPAEVRPDNTDPLLGAVSGNSCEIDMAAYSSYTFLFFKDNPSAVYDSNGITAAKTAG